MSRPAGRWTIMSGRSRPFSASTETCSEKSRPGVMPASFDDAPEVHLAPEPDRLRRAQRAGEVARLALNFVLAVAEQGGLLAEFRVGLVQDLEALLVALERLGERLEDFLDGLAALFEVAVLLRDERLEVRAREADELGAVGLERLAGERLERLLEFRARVVEQRELLLGSARGRLPSAR